MRATAHKPVWLSGYYPPKMRDWSEWQNEWSMGPHAEADWVWFDGDFDEAEARKRLLEATDNDRAGNNPVPR